jgi:hypothetical protein
MVTDTRAADISATEDTMASMLLWVGRLAGLGGAFLTLFAMAVRLSGRYVLGYFQAGTLLLAGMSLMTLGCLAYVAALAERSAPAIADPDVTRPLR